MRFRLVHSVGNRARWRTADTMSDATARLLVDEIAALEGVAGARVNPLTGSVLVTFGAPRGARAVARYLARLDREPPARRSLSPEWLACLPARAERRFEARRDEPAGQVARTLERAVSEMPVLRVARAAVGQGPLSTPENESGELDFSSLARWLVIRPVLPMVVNVANTLLGAIPFLGRGTKNALTGRIDTPVLDACAILISIILRDFGTAGLIILLLGVGDMLERYTRKKSLDSLAEQLALRVDQVWVRTPSGEPRETPLASVSEGDIVIVRTGTVIPVDGVVVAGDAAVNQATMTGEPLPVHRERGGSVFAGTVVEEGELDIRVTKKGGGTRLEQIVSFIESSEKRKAGIQSRAEHLADAIVPFNLGLATLVFAVTRNLARTAAVLTVDYSCALRLATPLAIMTAMKTGARNGALIKGGRYIETLSEIDTVVFDKTGTLTRAQPELSDVISVDPARDESDILALAACLEEHFPHPLSRAVVRAAEQRGVNHFVEEHDAEVRYVVAHGICSAVDGSKVIIGSRHFVEDDEGVDLSVGLPHIRRLASEGKTVLYMAYDGRLIGLLGIFDPVRPESRRVVADLRARGVRRVVMLTGDDERAAAKVSEELGLDGFRAQVLPADKAGKVQELRQSGCRVLMLGDGVNDSPALSSADVGATLRDGSDIAQEVSDIVLTRNSLADLPYAIDLSRATMRRIRQDFAVSVGLNTVFMMGGLFGLLTPALGAVLHNATTIGVCLNAMRPQRVSAGEN